MSDASSSGFAPGGAAAAESVSGAASPSPSRSNDSPDSSQGDVVERSGDAIADVPRPIKPPPKQATAFHAFVASSPLFVQSMLIDYYLHAGAGDKKGLSLVDHALNKKDLLTRGPYKPLNYDMRDMTQAKQLVKKLKEGYLRVAGREKEKLNASNATFQKYCRNNVLRTVRTRYKRFEGLLHVHHFYRVKFTNDGTWTLCPPEQWPAWSEKTQTPESSLVLVREEMRTVIMNDRVCSAIVQQGAAAQLTLESPMTLKRLQKHIEREEQRRADEDGPPLTPAERTKQQHPLVDMRFLGKYLNKECTRRWGKEYVLHLQREIADGAADDPARFRALLAPALPAKALAKAEVCEKEPEKKVEKVLKQFYEEEGTRQLERKTANVDAKAKAGRARTDDLLDALPVAIGSQWATIVEPEQHNFESSEISKHDNERRREYERSEGISTLLKRINLRTPGDVHKAFLAPLSDSPSEAAAAASGARSKTKRARRVLDSDSSSESDRVGKGGDDEYTGPLNVQSKSARIPIVSSTVLTEQPVQSVAELNAREFGAAKRKLVPKELYATYEDVKTMQGIAAGISDQPIDSLNVIKLINLVHTPEVPAVGLFIQFLERERKTDNSPARLLAAALCSRDLRQKLLRLSYAYVDGCDLADEWFKID